MDIFAKIFILQALALMVCGKDHNDAPFPQLDKFQQRKR